MLPDQVWVTGEGGILVFACLFALVTWVGMLGIQVSIRCSLLLLLSVAQARSEQGCLDIHIAAQLALHSVQVASWHIPSGSMQHPDVPAGLISRWWH